MRKFVKDLEELNYISMYKIESLTSDERLWLSQHGNHYIENAYYDSRYGECGAWLKDLIDEEGNLL